MENATPSNQPSNWMFIRVECKWARNWTWNVIGLGTKPCILWGFPDYVRQEKVDSMKNTIIEEPKLSVGIVRDPLVGLRSIIWCSCCQFFLCCYPVMHMFLFIPTLEFVLTSAFDLLDWDPLIHWRRVTSALIRPLYPHDLPGITNSVNRSYCRNLGWFISDIMYLPN